MADAVDVPARLTIVERELGTIRASARALHENVDAIRAATVRPGLVWSVVQGIFSNLIYFVLILFTAILSYSTIPPSPFRQLSSYSVGLLALILFSVTLVWTNLCMSVVQSQMHDVSGILQSTPLVTLSLLSSNTLYLYSSSIKSHLPENVTDHLFQSGALTNLTNQCASDAYYDLHTFSAAIHALNTTNRTMSANNGSNDTCLRDANGICMHLTEDTIMSFAFISTLHTRLDGLFVYLEHFASIFLILMGWATGVTVFALTFMIIWPFMALWYRTKHLSSLQFMRCYYLAYFAVVSMHVLLLWHLPAAKWIFVKLKAI